MTVENLINESVLEALGHEKRASKVFIDADEMKKISDSLVKISSLPYKQEAYTAVCGIMKVASGAINDILSEFDHIRNKNSELEKISEVRGVIDEMLERGLITKFEIQEKTAELIKKSEREMEVVKEAISLTSEKMSGNIFASSETEKTAADSSVKKGIFEEVIN